MRAATAAAVGVVALVAGCGRPGVTLIPADELPADVYASPPSSPAPQLPETGTVYMVRDGRLVPVTTSLPVASSLPEALLRALFDGPESQAVGTAIPSETRLISVEVDGGVAHADLTDEFESSAPGRVLGLRVAQVVYTLTESPSVIAVTFSIEGEPAGVLSGEGRVVESPVTRGDYRRFAPPSPEEEEDAARDRGDARGGGDGRGGTRRGAGGDREPQGG